MSAAMTYYTMLSMAPMLMIAIAASGYLFNDGLAQTEIIEFVSQFTTQSVAETVATLIKNATSEYKQRPRSSIIAGTISLLILIYGASGVFSQLHDTFNEIWKVPGEMRRGIWFSIHKRLVGIVMVLSMGVVLLSAISFNAAIEYVDGIFQADYPSVVSYLHLADKAISYLVIPIALAFMYWLIPATQIKWNDGLLAAMIAAILIGFSRNLIDIYLKFSKSQVVYGSAGSLVALLIWVYLVGLAVFYGAAFSHAWANTFGSRRPGHDDPVIDASSRLVKSKP